MHRHQVKEPSNFYFIVALSNPAECLLSMSVENYTREATIFVDSHGYSDDKVTRRCVMTNTYDIDHKGECDALNEAQNTSPLMPRANNIEKR